MNTKHGIVVPLSAIRTKNSSGIGEFLDLIPLIDWCHDLGLEVIQLLPLNDSGNDPSPYNLFSSCALNPIYISLHALGFLKSEPSDSQRVDYPKVLHEKMAWLEDYFEKTGKKLLDTEEFRQFVLDNPWLSPYAKHKDKERSAFHEFLQFIAYKQLSQAKAYGLSKNVQLMGDIPILVGRDSADVAVYKEFFDLDYAAGSAPDAFNWDGQYWGFPLFKWDKLKQNDYSWWKQRLRYGSNFYDIFRIDHVVGIFRIWGIPFGKSSKEGHFMPEDDSHWFSDGKERLEMMIQASPMIPIAEDLGTVPPQVRVILSKLGICGTKVMRWERNWETDKSFIPYQNYPQLSLTTVSTHDTETLTLWWRDCTDEAKDYAQFKNWTYTPELSLDHRKTILWESHHTPSLYHINLLQEYLAFFPELIWPKPEDERINIPKANIPTNWTYRFRPSLEELSAHDKLKSVIKSLILLICFFVIPIFGSNKEEALFRSLDPLSISEHLAFYELYPECSQGQQALSHAWELLSGGKNKENLILPRLEIQPIISLITRQSFEQPVKLPPEQLEIIQKMCVHFPNRKLKGFELWTNEEILKLTPEEVDLGRGILVNQFQTKDEILQYEATLDLIALQIQARLPKNATPYEKIKEINRFIFQEMQFRFPPHSLYATDIDLYTFLPSVLDSRQGVCLGVSILYLCLSQRLDLDLEIITPPGHIYVRYREGDHIVNIETTARGINLPSEMYLGINTRKLQERTIKEVIGMAFFNQASVFWGRQDYAKAVELYEKTLAYVPDDPLVHMLLGLNYLFTNKKEQALKFLKPLNHLTFDYAVSPESIPADYLAGKVDIEGLKTIFMHVDEKRSSILEKQKKIQQVLKKYPQFRGGLMHLAITYLQLGRTGEALEILEKYHKLDPRDANVEYYLTAINLERYDIPHAWQYFKQTESLVTSRDHHPKALKGLKQHLRTFSPEP